MTVQPYPTEMRGTTLLQGHSPIRRYGPPGAARLIRLQDQLSDEALRSSRNCAPDFELIRCRNKEAGEETELEAAVVEIVDLNERDETQRDIETHVELAQEGNSTRDRCATSAHIGPFPVYLHPHARLARSENVGAPPRSQEAGGLLRLFSVHWSWGSE